MGNNNTIKSSRKLFYNGKFFTLDKQNTVVCGLIVENKKIVEILNTEEDVQRNFNINKKINCEGKIIIPGFIMSHTHFLTYSFISNGGISVSPMNLFFDDNYIPPTTSKEVIERLKTSSFNEIIFAQGYDPILQPGNIITRLDLDGVSTTKPVYLMSASMHCIYVNTLVLINAGLIESIKDDGTIVLSDKVPDNIKDEVSSGEFPEEAMFLIADTFPKTSYEKIIEGLNCGSKILNKKGITTVGDATVPLSIFPIYRDYSFLNPKIRIVCFPIYDENITKFVHGSFIIPNKLPNTDYFFTGPTKIIGDGSIAGYTAFLTEPYISTPFFDVENPNEWKGIPDYTKFQLYEVFGNIYKSGNEIAIHANGDADIDYILESFEIAQKKYNIINHRTRIEHCTMVRSDQLERIKNLEIMPSFLNNHLYYYGDSFYENLIGERAQRIDPAGEAYKMNIIFDFHSDAPVTPPDPLFQIWIAVNRLTKNGTLLGKDQCIPVLEAVKAFTINSAYSLKIDNKVGSLEIGKFADMVILSEDIFSSDNILNIKILHTFLGGKKL